MWKKGDSDFSIFLPNNRVPGWAGVEVYRWTKKGVSDRPDEYLPVEQIPEEHQWMPAGADAAAWDALRDLTDEEYKHSKKVEIILNLKPTKWQWTRFDASYELILEPGDVPDVLTDGWSRNDESPKAVVDNPPTLREALIVSPDQVDSQQSPVSTSAVPNLPDVEAGNALNLDTIDQHVADEGADGARDLPPAPTAPTGLRWVNGDQVLYLPTGQLPGWAPPIPLFRWSFVEPDLLLLAGQEPKNPLGSQVVDEHGKPLLAAAWHREPVPEYLLWVDISKNGKIEAEIWSDADDRGPVPEDFDGWTLIDDSSDDKSMVDRCKAIIADSSRSTWVWEQIDEDLGHKIHHTLPVGHYPGWIKLNFFDWKHDPAPIDEPELSKDEFTDRNKVLVHGASPSSGFIFTDYTWHKMETSGARWYKIFDCSVRVMLPVDDQPIDQDSHALTVRPCSSCGSVGVATHACPNCNEIVVPSKDEKWKRVSIIDQRTLTSKLYIMSTAVLF